MQVLAAAPGERTSHEPGAICRWHSYPIRLSDGAKPYRPMEFGADKKLHPAGWAASEHRQRVHDVREQNGMIQVPSLAVSPDQHAWRWAHCRLAAPRVLLQVRLSSEARVGRHDEDAEVQSDCWAYNASAAKNVSRSLSTEGTDGRVPA